MQLSACINQPSSSNLAQGCFLDALHKQPRIKRNEINSLYKLELAMF